MSAPAEVSIFQTYLQDIEDYIDMPLGHAAAVALVYGAMSIYAARGRLPELREFTEGNAPLLIGVPALAYYLAAQYGDSDLVKGVEDVIPESARGLLSSSTLLFAGAALGAQYYVSGSVSARDAVMAVGLSIAANYVVTKVLEKVKDMTTPAAKKQ